MYTIKASLIKKAAQLLDSISETRITVIEIYFNDRKRVIEAWDMLTDEETLIAAITYED